MSDLSLLLQTYLENSQIDWAKYQPSKKPVLKPKYDPRKHQESAITDTGLSHFQQAYSCEGSVISKEDLFYYIYGLLHSPEYRSRYADHLSKELPRIPAVKQFADFMAYSQAGRDLAHWHLDYETEAKHKGAKLDYGKRDLKALNDANLWATETMGNAKYPLELFLRVITVSLETNKIVASLPKLEIDESAPLR